MGMSVSPQIWQQFVDLVFQDNLIKCKENFDVIMDDTFIHSTVEEHMDDLLDLLKMLQKYGLKISPHKCQFFKKKIVYMGLEFQVNGNEVCYTPLKDKCEAEKAFNDIKKLLVNPPVLKAPKPDGLFRLESNTSQEGVGGTLLQKQGNEWVVIGYHLKGLPPSAKNSGITKLELTGLLVNIHSFMQLLHNMYFKVLVDHKAIEYMIKSKTESPTTRLKTLLLKLSEYTIDLKYQKGSEMHTSNALSRLQNIADTADNKDVIPQNVLQHLAPNYIEHTYSHLVENFYVHKTKSIDTTQFKRK